MSKTTRKPRNFATATQLAKALDKPNSTVSGWMKHDWWIWSKKAPWPADVIPKILRAVANNMEVGRPGIDRAPESSKTGKTRKLRDEKLKEEIRKLRAQADQAETDLAKARGDLLNASDVEREWTSVGVVVRNSIENLPSQIVPLALSQGMPHEAADKLRSQAEELIAGILRHLSRDRNQEADEGEAAVLPEPVSEGAMEPKRVGGKVPSALAGRVERAGSVPI